MFRLLKISSVNYSRLKTLESYVQNSVRSRLCSHCNALHVHTQFSYRFVHTNAVDKPPTGAKNIKAHVVVKKKRVRRTNAEMLAAGGFSSNQIKKEALNKGAHLATKNSPASLKKPKSKLTASQTNLEALHEIPDDPDLLLEHDLQYTNSGLETGSESSLLGPESEKKMSRRVLSEELKKQQEALIEQQEIARRTETVTKNLLCYLDVCVSCGFMNKGFSVLMHYTSKQNKHHKIGKLTNVALYNTLIHGYAAMGNIRQVSELMDIMKYSDVTPNAASFAGCFECAGRVGKTFQSEIQLKEWSRQMSKNNISMQSLFSSIKLLREQKEMILKACLIIDPRFEPQIPDVKYDYECSLIKNLNPFELANTKRVEQVMDAAELREKATKQLKLEKAGSVTVRSVEISSQPPEATNFYRAKLTDLQSKWKEVLEKSFFRNLQALKHVHYNNSKGMTVYPFLKVLNPDEYVNIMFKEVRKLAEGSETFSPSMHLLFKSVGEQVLSRYQVHTKLKTGVVENTEKVYNKYCEWFADNESAQVSNTRIKWQQLLAEHEDGSSVHVVDKTWSQPILIDIGKFLYNIIMQDILLDVHLLNESSKQGQEIPAFYSCFRFSGKIIREEIKPHPVLAKLFRLAALETLEFPTSLVPMVSPPLPWTSIQHGGHLITSTELVRLPHQAVTQWERMEASPVHQLYPSFDALNQLGSIPWKINEPMLDLVTEVFVSGGSAELDIPQSPPVDGGTSDPLPSGQAKEEKMDTFKQRLALRRHRAEQYSMWCDTLYRLSLANHYRKEVFWLPHNMDFRGRVYPCPPHLSHLGNDMARSILCFAKGEPLGKKGLDWLKIHVINLTGLKKRDAVADRLRYANDIMSDILDSADNPLNGRRWWVKSDEPWQTLAGCKEIANAIRSPNPEEYVCYMPIHQDGSCNGLQHYAALGRDAAGALSVNLAPAETPQDVYSCVVTLVENCRARDAANGLKIAQVLDGFIKRKVIKQTVMTTVYGVTRFGARLQIAKQLKDIDGFPKDLVFQASQYLVAKTFESLGEMFTSTKEIQDWLTDSARMISHIRGKKVEWVTPLGLPVVQPYIRDNVTTIVNPKATNLKYIQPKQAMDSHGRPNVMKQKNAFPPNFIHSLDSSHMMLTSLHCEQKGISFVSVHDCFWTHPSTVDAMNLICRQQFVALHSQPILEDLSKSLLKNFSYDDIGWALPEDNEKLNSLLRSVPSKGEFDLSKRQ
ncbi:Hypothetical predicted protein [Cloeon dipterum]|uniref:DNA-directed RNA polymerase n=1 Tax=Cloeon dipterum TaxID=197152 RepID=A0A8S1DX90_9INSE|nr:Hypothetical predicted protein [Cloeon dipterum]